MAALRRLGELADKNSVRINLCIYGGCAMMLAYDRKRVTRDVDEIFYPPSKIQPLICKVAQEHKLPEDWINDKVKQFLGTRESLRELPMDLPGLQITVPTAGYLLAMKALACRCAPPGYKGDEEDLRYLIKKLAIPTFEEIQNRIHQYYPDDVPSPLRSFISGAINQGEECVTVYTQRPKTFKEVAKQSSALEQFGLLLREWIHEVTRGDISNRPALKKTIEQPPQKLKNRFDKGEVADAYLCSYAEWIADQAGIERPAWVQRKDAQLQSPWFSDNARTSLLIETPASFRQRGVFTIPEPVVRLRRGRPRVSSEQKREKARLRDQRYRSKIREKLEKLKRLEDAGLA